MFSIKYQLFLNDLYYFNSVELLQYAMVKSYLEDIDFLLKTDKQVRFNKRQNRLYLDIDWSQKLPDTYFVIGYTILSLIDNTKSDLHNYIIDYIINTNIIPVYKLKSIMDPQNNFNILNKYIEHLKINFFERKRDFTQSLPLEEKLLRMF